MDNLTEHIKQYQRLQHAGAIQDVSRIAFEPKPSDFRISPRAFTVCSLSLLTKRVIDTFQASIFIFLGIAIIVASIRIYLRIKAFRKLNVDDCFMVAAVILFAASTGATQASRDLMYLQMFVDTGNTIPDFTFPSKMLLYTKLNTAEYMLQWSCIYCVKFSYVFFFLPLTSRIRVLRIWWWILVAVMVPAASVTVFLAPWVCSHYDMSFFGHCVYNGSVIVHEQVILRVSTSLDIATDLLVIYIPVWLLMTVKLELERKMALGVVLCLSIFMIILAIIRFSLVDIQLESGGSLPDTIWLFFWQSIESVVAIIMVPLTAFRSLYGQQRAMDRNKQRGNDYVNDSSSRKIASKNSTAGSSASDRSRSRTIYGKEEELKAMNIPPRVAVSDHHDDGPACYGQALGHSDLDRYEVALPA